MPSKLILTFVFTLICLTTQTLAAYAPGTPVFRFGCPAGDDSNAGAGCMGELPFSSATSIIALSGGRDSVGANAYYSMFIDSGSRTATPTAYKVTNGKTLYCPGFSYETSATGNMAFGFSTGIPTDNNTSIAVGAVCFTSDGPTCSTGNGGVALNATGPTSGVNTKQLRHWMAFPANNYVFFKASIGSANLRVFMECVEQ